MKKKKWIIALIIIILVAIIIAVITYVANGSNRYYKKESDKALAACMLVGEKYGIADFTFDHYTPRITDKKTGHTIESPTYYIECSHFDELSNEEIKSFFLDLRREYIDASCDYNCTGGIAILSGGNEYRRYISSSGTKLFLNGDIIDSKEYERHLNLNDNAGGSSVGGKCTICGKKATRSFQGSSYCSKHYNGAVDWAIDNVAGKED